MNEQAKNYLKRGFLSLEEKNFVEAESFFEDALNIDAEFSDAYMGKLLCDMLCTTEEELISLGVPVSDNNYFKYAKRFAESPARFDAIESKIRERAREKAAICHKDKNDNIAVLWLERIGEKDSDYGRYYQLSDYTDSFTSLDPGIFGKYPAEAKAFLNSVKNPELKQIFIEENQKYLQLAQAEQERLQRLEEEERRRIEVKKKIAEEKRRREEEKKRAEEKRRAEEEKKEKIEKERRAAALKKREKKEAIITEIISVLVCAGLGYLSIAVSIFFSIALYIVVIIRWYRLGQCDVSKLTMFLAGFVEFIAVGLLIFVSGICDFELVRVLLGTLFVVGIPVIITSISYLISSDLFFAPILLNLVSWFTFQPLIFFSFI